MIKVEFNDGTHSYALRDVTFRDNYSVAEMFYDWPLVPDDQGEQYNLDNANRDVSLWKQANDRYVINPIDPVTVTLIMTMDGTQVGLTRGTFQGNGCDITHSVIHPDYRGLGLFTIQQQMFRSLMVDLNVTDISFKVLDSAKAIINAHADKYLKLIPAGTHQGDTGQVLTTFQFTKTDYEAVLADPNSPETKSGVVVVRSVDVPIQGEIIVPPVKDPVGIDPVQNPVPVEQPPIPDTPQP
jgi:hypothetical protein